VGPPKDENETKRNYMQCSNVLFCMFFAFHAIGGWLCDVGIQGEGSFLSSLNVIQVFGYILLSV
jgi:hypothetical protein